MFVVLDAQKDKIFGLLKKTLEKNSPIYYTNNQKKLIGIMLMFPLMRNLSLINYNVVHTKY